MNLLNVLRYIAHDSIIYKQERLDYVHRKRFKRNIPIAPPPPTPTHTHKRGKYNWILTSVTFKIINQSEYALRL